MIAQPSRITRSARSRAETKAKIETTLALNAHPLRREAPSQMYAVVVRSLIKLLTSKACHFPLKDGFVFSRKVFVPSRKSSVEAISPK
jgi:hypothetical protein